jgi:hypothetical protein
MPKSPEDNVTGERFNAPRGTLPSNLYRQLRDRKAELDKSPGKFDPSTAKRINVHWHVGIVSKRDVRARNLTFRAENTFKVTPDRKVVNKQSTVVGDGVATARKKAGEWMREYLNANDAHAFRSLRYQLQGDPEKRTYVDTTAQGSGRHRLQAVRRKVSEQQTFHVGPLPEEMLRQVPDAPPSRYTTFREASGQDSESSNYR